MNKFTNEGGEMHLEGRKTQVVAPETDLEVLYIPPTESQPDASAFEDAIRVFDDVGAEFVAIGEVDRVAERAERLLGR